MTIERCPYCGTKLIETNWGRKHCPNCGIIEDNSNEEITEEKKEKTYIG